MNNADQVAIGAAESTHIAERFQLDHLPNGSPFPFSWHSSERMSSTLHSLREYLGEPTLYGGSTSTSLVEWHDPHHTLALRCEDGQRFLREEDHAKRPRECAEDRPVWLLYRGETASPPPPKVEAVTDWPSFEESLRTVLATMGSQIPDLLGEEEWVAFDLVNRDGDQVMAFMISTDEGLTALAPAQDEPEEGGVRPGWHEFVPLLRWWRADYELGDAGAAALAHLAVTDLRTQGAAAPISVSATKATCSNLGTLFLPGLGIPLQS